MKRKVLLWAGMLSVALAGVGFAATGNEQIAPNQPEYTLGDTAVIYGTGFEPGSSVIVEVIRADGSIVTGAGTETPGSDTVTANLTGAFTYHYLIDGGPVSAYNGILTVNAKDASTLAVLATTTFLDGTQFLLQGCSKDRGDCTLDSPATGWAGGATPMTGWTSGHLEGWFDGDDVPYRLRIGLRDEGSAGPKYFTTIHDNMRNGILGITSAGNFYVGYGPVGSLEGTLTKTCRLQASGSAVPTVSDPCIVTGPSYSGGDGSGPTPRQIEYAWAVLFDPDEDGGSDKKWAVYWTGHLDAGAHNWPGSSLHTSTTASGSQDVPIDDIEDDAPSGANLSITKTDTPDPAYVGENLIYTLTVTNNGPSSATNVKVTDTLPTTVTYVSATASPGTPDTCSMMGGTVTCNLGTLANAATATVTIVVTPMSAGTLCNSAIVSSHTSDPTPGNNNAKATTTVYPSANLSIVKNDSPDPAYVGENLTYTMTVYNAGPNTATNVSVTDTLPAGVDLVTFYVSQGTGCTQGTGTVTCNLGTLTKWSSATVTIVVKPTTAGTLTNTAAVSSTTHDPSSGNNTSTATTTVYPSANLSITKTGPSTGIVGQSISYTIVVSNAGPSAATGVSVTDNLPAGVTYGSASWTGASTGTCTFASPTVTCSIGTLASGASVTITITVTPTVNGTLNNSATVSSPTWDPTPGDHTTPPVTTTVTSSADLAITKSGPGSATVGAPFSYTIGVSNAGPSAATGVSVTDSLPTGLTYGSATWTGASSGTCTFSSPTVTCSIGTLASGASVTITITVTPTVNGTLNNSATVSSPTPDPNSGNNTTPPVSTTVTSSADLTISKFGPSTATVGQPMAYTIGVSNAGPSPATGVTVTDTLPAGVTYGSATWTGASSGTCAFANPTVTCSIGTLASGASVTITITVTPTATGTLNNSATVSSPTSDPTPGDHTTPTVQTTVSGTPSTGPLGGNAFSNAGGAMSSTNYQLITGVAGQGIGQGSQSTNYGLDAGYAPGVTGG
ncbi:MAG: DUF11 domain-containing protein [Nitrospirota bacterium]